MVRFVAQLFKIAVIAVLALVILAGAQRFFTYALAGETSHRPGPPVPFTVARDDDSATVAARLAAVRLVRSASLFKLQLMVTRQNVQPGTYTLHRGMSMPDIVAVLTGQATAVAGPATATPPPTGVLRIETVDAVTGQPLGGACYKLRPAGVTDCDNAAGTADPNLGSVTIPGLPPGAETVIQTKIPAGHLQVVPIQVQIRPGGTPSDVRIANRPVPAPATPPPPPPATAPGAGSGIGTLQITTVDAQSGKPLPGACYELRDGGPSYCDSGGSGVILLTDVVTGQRTVTQTAAPTGYQLAAPVQVQVNPGSTPADVTVKDQAAGHASPATASLPVAAPTIQPVGPGA